MEVDRPLRQALRPEHAALLRVIYEPYAASGAWPIWQYIDLTLDRLGYEASEVLATVPTARNPAAWGMNYSLVWYMNTGTMPSPDQQVGLTVAGLNHMPQARPLLSAFLETVKLLVAKQRDVIPSPREVVEETLTSQSIADHLLTESIEGASAPPVSMTLTKLYILLSQEPILRPATARPQPQSEDWIVRLQWELRQLRGVETINEYVDRIADFVAPQVVVAAPEREGRPHLPTTLGYLDAVWRNRMQTGLFAVFDPTSISRLTEPCSTEADFNSLLSSLADVLGQIIAPGKSRPSSGGALEAFRDAVSETFEPEAAVRVSDATNTLISIRRLRVSTQHSDARHRAVAAFEGLGLPFPPTSWSTAWDQIASLADGALTTIREEVLSGLQG